MDSTIVYKRVRVPAGYCTDFHNFIITYGAIISGDHASIYEQVPEDLDYDKTYTLTIPAISADCGYVTDEQTITFTTKQDYDESLAMSVDFEKQSFAPMTLGNRYSNPSYSYDETLGSNVATWGRSINYEQSVSLVKYTANEGKHGKISRLCRICAHMVLSHPLDEIHQHSI